MKHLLTLLILDIAIFINKAFNINTRNGTMIKYIKTINRKEYYKMLFRYRVIWPVVCLLALPFILLVAVLRKAGLLKVITDIVSRVLEARANRKHDRREALIKETQAHLHCKNIDTYPSFWMGDTCMGSYGNGLIKLNAKAKGVSLIETMFHEDRHFQQEQKNPKCFKNYIKAEDDYRGYVRQHVEKDARRYAYIKTMRYAKTKLGIRFYLFAPMYRLQSHPWKSVTLKKYR